MMLFDSHTHINSEEYNEDREELIRAIEASELGYVMNVGWDAESSLLALEQAKKYPWCYAAVGCHPHDAKEMNEKTMELFRQLAQEPKVKAIGEIGLDYYYDLSDREIQRVWFRHQLRLALELEMPIIIHTREADEETMTILKEEGVFEKSRTSLFPLCPDGLPDARLVMHCYSGSSEMAEQYVKLGATISFAGPITFKKSKKAVETAKKINLCRILAETDAPYLTPEPFRGRKNMAPYVEYTVKKIAEIKQISYEEVATATCENAKRFFNIIG